MKVTFAVLANETCSQCGQLPPTLCAVSDTFSEGPTTNRKFDNHSNLLDIFVLNRFNLHCTMFENPE